MKKNVCFLLVSTVLVLEVLTRSMFLNVQKSEKHQTPNDWFYRQRAFPYPEINYEARTAAWNHAQQMKHEKSTRGEGWILEGPYNTGGRISAVAMTNDADPVTIYAGAASGGVFKSTDSGESWTPVFDNALSLSIGDIAIAPSDEDIVWVGTGEANGGGGSMAYDGFGIYKSDDAGNTWQHTGLENAGSIGRVAVHPSDPMTCYVAAMGRMFSDNPDRGVFRTTDGGGSWEKVLYVNDSTGAVDIAIHPEHPDTLYAAMWERVRRPHRRDYGGPGCGIYRSYDGGNNWTLLTNGLPAASSQVGRIGIDISASDPNVLYAIYADNIGYFAGVYKTVNGGNSWLRTSDSELSDMFSSFGWWFGRISIDPVNPDIVYGIGLDLYKTVNGGNDWSVISYAVHVDQHDLAVHPAFPNFIVLGNDGGIYTSENSGSTWTFRNNLPITQFYTCEIDEQMPHRLYGGTQDNGTNRTLNGGADDWQNIYWGDGFYVLVDPLDNNYVYAEYQYGNFARSTNGGASFSSAMSGISSSDRKNWNTPFVFDPDNPQIIYYGANRLYKTTNRALSWQAISPDLTNGSAGGLVVYGTITTIAVAPSNSQFIYAGTDDGNVWRTPNGGTDWIKITDGLPLRWVTRVAVDPFDEEIVYVTLSGYRYDSYLPHVFRSEDAGETWDDISGNLPEAPVNDLIVDPVSSSTLYLATDFGVFMTYDLGQHWDMPGTNLPNVPIVDLDFHQPTRTLVAATYGRSMYSFNVDQLVSVTDITSQDGYFDVFPNPARKEINLRIDLANNAEFYFSNLNGQTLLKGVLKKGQTVHKIDISEIPSGFYSIRIITKNQILNTTFTKP